MPKKARQARQRRIEDQIDRVLNLLRHKIRAKGFTQMEVQEALGWGRSYISQLLTKQKTIRIDQIVMMLNVIGVDPEAFFGEIYGFAGDPYSRELREIKKACEELVKVLIDKRLIEFSELETYVNKARAQGSAPWITITP